MRRSTIAHLKGRERSVRVIAVRARSGSHRRLALISISLVADAWATVDRDCAAVQRSVLQTTSDAFPQRRDLIAHHIQLELATTEPPKMLIAHGSPQITICQIKSWSSRPFCSPRRPPELCPAHVTVHSSILHTASNGILWRTLGTVEPSYWIYRSGIPHRLCASRFAQLRGSLCATKARGEGGSPPRSCPAQEMEGGPPQPPCRRRLQTTYCCCVQETWW